MNRQNKGSTDIETNKILQTKFQGNKGPRETGDGAQLVECLLAQNSGNMRF